MLKNHFTIAFRHLQKQKWWIPAGGSLVPQFLKRNGNTFYNEGKTKEERGVGAQSWTMDEDYPRTMGIHLIGGRNFFPEIASDSQAVIINQTMADRLNLKDPVGKRISTGWATFNVTCSGGCSRMAGLSAVLIALVTVSFQAVKAALENPVKNLRAE